MANTYVDIEDEFKISDDQDVVVSVTIGNAQAGSYTIFHGTQHKGSDKPVNLGKGSLLHNTKLFITSVCRDIRKETNWISVAVDMAGKTYGPYSKKVEKDLDTVTYSITIDLS